MKEHAEHLPTEINLHKKSRLLSITFDNGRRFDYPCEYLRVFSRAAEVRTMDTPVTGKERVNIEAIEPQGGYAIRIVFDDGHDTSIYSWDTLYELGENQEANWADYLRRLEEIGYRRDPKTDGERTIRILYFNYLAQKLGKESEERKIPPNVETVTDLLAWLRRQYPIRAYLLSDDHVRITVNKQFAEPFTRVDGGDEIGLVPNSPNPPSPPRS